MQEDLAFVQLQLWVVIGLLGVFVLTNIYCYLATRQQRKSDEPSFSSMWDKDQLDNLIQRSQEYLRKYPNHQSALYFGAKALIARRRFSEARINLEKLSEIEPSLRSSYQDMIDECKKHHDS
jgi:cytochrome c-type biogenesis protein CcmH/NrfG